MTKHTLSRFEEELRPILRDAVLTPRRLRAVAERITAMTPADRPQTDSTEIIRAMRDGGL